MLSSIILLQPIKVDNTSMIRSQSLNLFLQRSIVVIIYHKETILKISFIYRCLAFFNNNFPLDIHDFHNNTERNMAQFRDSIQFQFVKAGTLISTYLQNWDVRSCLLLLQMGVKCSESLTAPSPKNFKRTRVTSHWEIHMQFLSASVRAGPSINNSFTNQVTFL